MESPDELGVKLAVPGSDRMEQKLDNVTAGYADGEEELSTRQLTIERKRFFFDLKRNRSGKYLKISEKSGGKKHSIVIPGGGLLSFLDVIREMLKSEI